MTLEEIIKGCQSGNECARRELYERYGTVFYSVVRRYVRDVPTAEDLFHDGFVTLFTHISDYRGEGSFEGWCRRIFVNTVLSHFRKRNPLISAEEVDNIGTKKVSEPTAIEELSAGEIKQCVDRLPAGYKTIFNLHAVDGYSYAEIAGMLDVSETTARSQFLRARTRLMEMLDKFQPRAN